MNSSCAVMNHLLNALALSEKSNRMPPNSALLTDAFSLLRCACGAANRER
jgi:hypothetical protein